MSDRIEQRLRELGITLPKAAAPAANYLPYRIDDRTVFVSGQLPMEEGAVAVRGRLGENVSLEEGQRAARLCALNLLAQVRAAAGGQFRGEVHCRKLGGFVAATPGFEDHPKVINGASDLMVEILGPAGRHARFAVGVASLPFGAAVEIDGVFELT